MTLGTIGQIAMRAKDVDRATAFYKDALGLPFLFRFGDLSFFNCDGVRLMISKPETAAADHPGSVLYFKVGDIRAARDELAGRGVRFIDEPHLIARMPDHELWMVFFHDTEDNTLALMSEVRS